MPNNGNNGNGNGNGNNNGKGSGNGPPEHCNSILNRAGEHRKKVKDNLRNGATWFHRREGQMFDRGEAIERVADFLDVDETAAANIISGLTEDLVDPVVLIAINDERHVGIIEYEEFEGAYGYMDYHSMHGERRRVVCAQCVHESEYDTQVTHATAGDPEGSFGADATYEQLLDAVHDHYDDEHDGIIPANVKTGADLASETTIGGNTSWHAGNDGSGTGLAADTVDDRHFSDIQSWVNNNADVPNSDKIDGKRIYVQSTEPSNPSENDIWIDTS